MSDPLRPIPVLDAWIAYYRAEAEVLELRARAFSKTDKLRGAILRRRDATLALADALEAERTP